MDLYLASIWISSLSFFGYGISYFVKPNMKEEFKRFGLEKIGLFVVILEILGALGLLVGLLYVPILILSSAGLALLMFFGLIVRLRLKDSLWISLPATFFVLLNTYIFLGAIN